MNEIKFCLSHIVWNHETNAMIYSVLQAKRIGINFIIFGIFRTPHSPRWGGWDIIEILITQAMDDNKIDSYKWYEGDLRIDLLTKFGM